MLFELMKRENRQTGRNDSFSASIPILTPDECREASLKARFPEKWKLHLGEHYGKGSGFTLPPEV